MRKEVSDRKMLELEEEHLARSVIVDWTRTLSECRILEMMRSEKQGRLAVASMLTAACRGIYAAKEDLRLQCVRELHGGALAQLAAVEAGERTSLCVSETAQRNELVRAARVSLSGAQLVLLPQAEAKERAAMRSARDFEVAVMAATCHADNQRTARAVMERREAARRRMVANAEAVEFKRLVEDSIADRVIAEATTAFRTHQEHSLAVPLPPAALRRLQYLAEEEEDERELLLLNEVRVRGDRLPSASSSIYGSQGGVDSVREASASQVTRPCVNRQRSRGSATNSALQRWVRFNR